MGEEPRGHAPWGHAPWGHAPGNTPRGRGGGRQEALTVMSPLDVLRSSVCRALGSVGTET